MIVYGDPQFATTIGAARAGLLARLDGRPGRKAPGVDDLRTLLILLGQLEQAVDDLPDAGCYPQLTTATDVAAGAFVSLLMGGVPDASWAARLRNLLGELD